MSSHLHARDALIVPPSYRVERTALRGEPFSAEEIAAMRRHVRLAEDLRRCRYFTDEERRMSFTMDEGATSSFEITLPDAGATRDMVGLLRQLFGDGERASFASMAAVLRQHADPESQEGQTLLEVVAGFESARQGVLDSWDARPGGSEAAPHPPLTVFRDWLYGEYLPSDADKGRRIEELNAFQLYEWQFHWVAERLAILLTSFARIVGTTLEAVPTVGH